MGVRAFSAGAGVHRRASPGAPGAGKSTLTSSAVATARAAGERVAVLAIDPSSPFTGGALLGDRTRMNDHALDRGVFIRSMATRGHLGGLALAAPEAIRVLDAVGFPWVLVETVGVGQVEVEVAGAADTTVVVVNPGWGDSVQANKAGLMEIADVFVVNKADRPGASQTAHDLESMLDLTRGSATDGAGDHRWCPRWAPPARAPAELWDAIHAHRAHLVATGELERRRQQRLREELALVVEQRLRAEAEARLGRRPPGHRGRPAGPAHRSVVGCRPHPRRPARVPTMNEATAPLVTIERHDDGVAIVRLQNPKVNAISSEVLRQLKGAVDALNDNLPGAVVVTGGDRIFAAGADITEFAGPDEARATGGLFLDAFNALAALPRPTIASISGFALGGGCELALACDLRIASTQGPSSASPRSCSASSRAAVAPSGSLAWWVRPGPRT